MYRRGITQKKYDHFSAPFLRHLSRTTTCQVSKAGAQFSWGNAEHPSPRGCFCSSAAHTAHASNAGRLHPPREVGSCRCCWAEPPGSPPGEGPLLAHDYVAWGLTPDHPHQPGTLLLFTHRVQIPVVNSSLSYRHSKHLTFLLIKELFYPQSPSTISIWPTGHSQIQERGNRFCSPPCTRSTLPFPSFNLM